jgi:hypothetical protein
VAIGGNTAADNALIDKNAVDFQNCNALIANIAFFRADGSPDPLRTDRAQTQLQALTVLFTMADLVAAGVSAPNYWLQKTNWTTTLAARKAALATF